VPVIQAPATYATLNEPYLHELAEAEAEAEAALVVLALEPEPSELIVVSGGEPRTTTLAIAEGTGVEHKSVIQLVRNNQCDFKEFGEVTFEMRLNKQGSPTEYALLNEPQATLACSQSYPRINGHKA